MAKLNDIIARVRAHPQVESLPIAQLDDEFNFTVAQLILTVLNDLTERISGDRGKRHYVLSDPDDTTVALDDDGVADLSDLIINKALLLESLVFGEITHPDSPFPLKPMSGSGKAALGNAFGTLDFLRYWLVGRKLHTLSADNNHTPLAGELSLAVPVVPGLDTLSSQLEDDLVDSVVTRLRGVSVLDPKQAVAQ